MLLGARQDCVGCGTTITEKMTILRQFGYDFLELALTQSEIIALDAAVVAKDSQRLMQTGRIRSSIKLTP
jgi:hypothetical protein